MSKPSQSTSVLPQSPKKPISANTPFTDLPSSLDQQQRNASKLMKASVKAASGQPSVAMLASLGIKVRDFAYESKLPPIQPIYRHPRQIQPAVVRTTLKPQWTETGEDDPSSQSSSEPETSQKKLARTSTEPVIATTPGPPARTLSLTNVDHDSQQPNMYTESPRLQMLPSIFESQESEPYIDTPLVTPKGSLQWPVPDISSNSASELDRESQATELPSYSQMGLFQVSDTSFSPRCAVSNPSSPLASALPLSIDDGLSLSKTRLSRGKKIAVSLDQRPIDPTMPRILATGYHLRKRPAPSSSPFSPNKSSSRLHSLRPRGTVVPPSRPHCVSNQSSHARAKAKGGSSSRTLLRRAVTNGEEKRRRMG